MTRSTVWRALAACAGIVLATQAIGQAYPSKPIRVIVPSLPGGGFDVTARVLSERMGPLLGVQMTVENRSVAGTIGGTEAAAKAPADGYTVLIGGLSNIALNPGLHPNLGYDPHEFRPIGLAVSYSYTLVGRRDLPANTLREVIEYGRANPGKLTFGGAPGTGQHVAAVALFNQTKVDALSIFYKGATAVHQDLLGGRLDLYFDNTQTARTHIEKGAVKVYATSSPVRLPFLPNVPTVNETGVGKLEMETWFGPFVRRDTPQPIVSRLRAAFEKTMSMPEVVSRFENGSGRVLEMTQADTEAYVRAEIARWTKLIRDAGIKAP
ncbi:MAG: Bug family tripartite tricarboxylate transporter substrate binding protein [Pseudomonadota bacterium]|jgi:tripartite-type tricarboxylate transporter receptor subunit TctC